MEKDFEYQEHHVKNDKVKVDGFTMEVDGKASDEEILEALADTMLKTDEAVTYNRKACTYTSNGGKCGEFDCKNPTHKE